MAWLVRTASRRMIDQWRSDESRRAREAAAAPPETTPPDVPGEDDTLLLLFLCCHPSLTPGSAIPLTLRAVGGLTTAEIARAFLVPEPTMAQRISRAKQRIRDSAIGFAMPTDDELADRLRSVLRVLYLIFNEGYATSEGSDLQRVELADEAIRLARMLQQALPDEPEVLGLLSLMLLTDARRDARADAGGDLIPLPEQDRSRWDRARIVEGLALLGRAMGSGRVGEYRLQAPSPPCTTAQRRPDRLAADRGAVRPARAGHRQPGGHAQPGGGGGHGGWPRSRAGVARHRGGAAAGLLSSRCGPRPPAPDGG